MIMLEVQSGSVSSVRDVVVDDGDMRVSSGFNVTLDTVQVGEDLILEAGVATTVQNCGVGGDLILDSEDRTTVRDTRIDGGVDVTACYATILSGLQVFDSITDDSSSRTAIRDVTVHGSDVPPIVADSSSLLTVDNLVAQSVSGPAVVVTGSAYNVRVDRLDVTYQGSDGAADAVRVTGDSLDVTVANSRFRAGSGNVRWDHILYVEDGSENTRAHLNDAVGAYVTGFADDNGTGTDLDVPSGGDGANWT